MKILHLSVLSILILSAGLSLATSRPSGEDTATTDFTVVETDTLNLDSIREARRIEGFVTAADESYKRFRTMRFDGYDEKDYYPMLMECYTANVTAIDSLPGHPRADASKAVILDIYKDLLEGAFFCSASGDNAGQTRFAQAYLDVADMPCMADEHLQYDQRVLPAVAYIAASGAYNNHRFNDAIRYFDKYLATPDQNHRENVYYFLGQACLFAKDYEHAVNSMAEGAVLYPTNYNILTIGLQACKDGGLGENMQFFLDKALMLKPNDEQLLDYQGKMFEDKQEYRSAIDVYHRLDEMRPNNMSITQHLALCYYNLGVHYYNASIMSEDEKTAKKNKRQSNAYFSEASHKLEEVVANAPLSIKYLKALAVTYGCCDENEKFEEIHNRLRALGQYVEKSKMPSMIAFNEDNSTNFASGKSAKVDATKIPDYSEFGKTYITDGLAKWATRGQYEKISDYTRRVSEENAQKEYVRLCKEAEQEYLEKYSHKLRINDLKLSKYDPDNETYLIHSDYGDMTLKVPLKNNEAEHFSASWDKIQLRAPMFYIQNNKPTISSVTFVTNGGKSYTYNADNAATYAYTPVKVDIGSFINQADEPTPAATPGTSTAVVITKQSDVDGDNIPIVKRPNEHTVALIFANENYKNVSNVASALHDGDTFKDYCIRTLSIPPHRVKYFKDATLVDIFEGLSFVKNEVSALKGDVDIIIYYAGHGIPDEATTDAFLLPVDGNATVSRTCISLNNLYEELNAMGARSTMVFLDACFSGAKRGDGMLVGARGIAIKPRAAAPKGNMFVLSAASGKETAMPYADKNHGLFTYYLLKILQKSKGNATLKEISDYVTNNVSEQSNVINSKPQNPQVSLSGNMGDLWEKRTLRD